MDIPTLLNQAKSANDLTSDYALARQLNVSTGHVSQWRSGKCPIDDYNLLRISNMAGVSHSQALAARALAREQDLEKRRFWQAIERAAACVAACVLTTVFMPKTADAYNNFRRGGSGEIRTHERVAPSPVFKTGAFNRSATLPALLNNTLIPRAGRF